MFGSEEIRIYSIRDDKKLTFSNVSFIHRFKVSRPIGNLFVHLLTDNVGLCFGACPIQYKLLGWVTVFGRAYHLDV